MFVIMSKIDLSDGLIELVIISGDHVITGCWLPKKYPDKARIEKIVRGKPLDRASFI